MFNCNLEVYLGYLVYSDLGWLDIRVIRVIDLLDVRVFRVILITRVVKTITVSWIVAIFRAGKTVIRNTEMEGGKSDCHGLTESISIFYGCIVYRDIIKFRIIGSERKVEENPFNHMNTLTPIFLGIITLKGTEREAR